MGGGGRENGIEFQRSNVCLNEFPAPLMLRGGRASKRGGIDSEIMLVCVSTDECVFFFKCAHVAVQLCGSRPQLNST